MTETADPKAVRRAYAARLKAIDPDRDTAAFQQLRMAYDWALAMAERKAKAMPTVPAASPTAAAPELFTVFEPPTVSPDEMERQRVVRAIQARLKASDPREAAQLLVAALAQGALSLESGDQMRNKVMATVAADGTITPQDYLALMHNIGWDLMPRQRDRTSPARKTAIARAEAEHWYLGVRQIAQRRNWLWHKNWKVKDWLVDRRESRAARALVERWQFVRLSNAGILSLRRMFDHYQHYVPWIAHRFDPGMPKRIERLLKWSRYTAKVGPFAYFAVVVTAGLMLVFYIGSTGYSYFAFAVVFLFRLAYSFYRKMMA